MSHQRKDDATLYCWQVVGVSPGCSSLILLRMGCPSSESSGFPFFAAFTSSCEDELFMLGPRVFRRGLRVPVMRAPVMVVENPVHFPLASDGDNRMCALPDMTRVQVFVTRRRNMLDAAMCASRGAFLSQSQTEAAWQRSLHQRALASTYDMQALPKSPTHQAEGGTHGMIRPTAPVAQTPPRAADAP